MLSFINTKFAVEEDFENIKLSALMKEFSRFYRPRLWRSVSVCVKNGRLGTDWCNECVCMSKTPFFTVYVCVCVSAVRNSKKATVFEVDRYAD